MKIWRHVATGHADTADMARALQVPRAVAAALRRRGIDISGAPDFLDPRLANLADPFLLPDMAAAVQRLWRAIERGERIAVFGDYDADGVTATAVIARVLTMLGATVATHLPHRADEGYGLSTASLRRCLAETRPDLLLTVDCGSCSADAVLEARRAGVETIVTDHHLLLADPAPALAVVNPKRTDKNANSAVTDLAGVGVAFKLCHAVVKQGRATGVSAAVGVDLRGLLELVVLGTVADVVPLRGENRILVSAGLKNINCRPGPALRALAAAAGVRTPVTARHVAFALGPRLNAAGRLGDAHAALDLLMTDDPGAAGELALQLDAANRDRRKLVETITAQAHEQIAGRQQGGLPFGIVVGARDWHIGVIGIVAARIAQHYHRPAVVVSFDEDNHGRGSARGIEDFNLLQGLQACADNLLTFGGHASAAGLSLHAGEFETFRRRFDQAAATVLQDRDPCPVLDIEDWLMPAEINTDLVVAQESMEPFGEGNPQPVWALRAARIRGRPRIVGAGHVKMTLECGETPFDAIGFNMGERELPDGPLDVAFHLDRNEYQGRNGLQINLRDFRPSGQ